MIAAVQNYQSSSLKNPKNVSGFCDFINESHQGSASIPT